ncbi:MAG TPA: M28 family peptidase [Longimicrobiaceae bacterium]|nr:M28 family peptidase [Longimicrobiaceae bacterium]
MKCRLLALAVAAVLYGPGVSYAQSFARPDPVLEAIWREGMDSSRVYPLAQALIDSIGPRLTGSPALRAANDWLVQRYRAWGIDARNEQYGTWRGWRRGVTHLDLLEPRVRTLEATMLAWSPGTRAPVRAAVVALPHFADAAQFERWLPSVRGRFVLASFPQPTCRPDESWQEWATPESFERMKAERARVAAEWASGLASAGVSPRDLPTRLEAAGAAGVLTSRWSLGWGVDKVFDAHTRRTPVLDVSCEDYGLLYRLAANGQGPVVRLDATAESLGEVPVFNTIAVLRGTEKPDEYVVLSAHLDSWDGGSGATDNGTGTITMLEAARILHRVYPHPKRTILIGHWSGEEQGLIGSNAFAADHPEVVKGLQALFNQDNGTGRVSTVTMQGFTRAAGAFGRWLALVPEDLARQITLVDPGLPSGGGSDNASFVCRGAPGFFLASNSWDYGTYTWHTNRDTFDKISFDDLRRNAVLTAMLAYLASEDPAPVSRERRTIFPLDPRTGEPMTWPQCRDVPRHSGPLP